MLGIGISCYAQGSRFCDEILAKQRGEFMVAAAEHRPPAGGALDALAQSEKDKGYLLFMADYEAQTFQTTVPHPRQMGKNVHIRACLGEYEPIAFAVRPLRDIGAATVTVSDFTGDVGINVRIR